MRGNVIGCKIWHPVTSFRVNHHFVIFFLGALKGQYHAIFSNTLKIEKTLFGC